MHIHYGAFEIKLRLRYMRISAISFHVDGVYGETESATFPRYFTQPGRKTADSGAEILRDFEKGT